MRFGVVLFTSDRGITPAQAAAAAEAAGFDTFYVPEHTHIPVRRDALHPRTGTQELPDDRYMRTLDPWVSLSMAAAVTQTIRLGTAVALPAEHDPISLAKTIASLDHLSGGRVQLGVGFGWNTDELTDHGVPARPPAHCAARVPGGHAGAVDRGGRELRRRAHPVRRLLGLAEARAAAGAGDRRRRRHGADLQLDRQVGRRLADHARRGGPGGEGSAARPVSGGTRAGTGRRRCTCWPASRTRTRSRTGSRSG